MSSSPQLALRPRLGLASSGGSGGHNHGGLALALSQSSSGRRSSSGARASNRRSEPFASVYGLREGETLDDVGIAERTIYTIRGADGTITGVRKIALVTDDRAGHFHATRNEAMTYAALTELADWRSYVIPYRGHVMNSQSVMIDFDWVDGSDLKHRLSVDPANALRYLDHAARALRWLALHGYFHGDIRADNFYCTDDGRILLLDFGRTTQHTTRLIMIAERRAFMALIAPFAPSATMQLLSEYPIARPLAEFYLVASRLLRRAGRGPRLTRRQRYRRRRTTSKQRQ